MAKDITKTDTLNNIHDDDLGTGIFWFLENGKTYEQIFVPRITSKRAQKLAKDFDEAGDQKLDAYRWVPEQLETVESLVSKPCGGKCTTDNDCVDYACRCINGRCQRK